MDEWRKLLKVAPENRIAASSLAGLLYQSEKYPEAVSVLEAAIKTAPDSSSLQMQLGSAYFKTGQKDKAVASYRAAVELKSEDPGTLNDVAYTLAENKAELGLALQYAQKAVAQLDKQVRNDSSDETELRTTYLYSLVWDTLGWVYFQQGDAKQAKNWIRPAWLLGEESVVGEHLGEIYEKEGRLQEAARSYLYALAVFPAPSALQLLGSGGIAAYQDQTKTLANRYHKLTGKEPQVRETRRLPNGEWTLTVAEQLVHTREVKLKNQKSLGGDARFLVEFKSGIPTAVRFRDGDHELEALSEELMAAHYPLAFPPDGPAILAVEVNLHCEPSRMCVAGFILPSPPAAGSQPGAN